MSDEQKSTTEAAGAQAEPEEGVDRMAVLRHTVKSLRQLGRPFHADDLEAAFPRDLVRAMTYHDELMSALRSADAWFRENYHRIPGGNNNPIWRKVCATLARAEGGAQ